MAYFPLFINMEGKKVLVIGGGPIAARRVKSLLEFGCRITVVAPELCEELRGLLDLESVEWVGDVYREKMLIEAPVFVLAAASAEVNGQVVRDCRKAGIPVNDSSRKENCDFYFPGLIKEGEVVIGVTSGGSDHKLVAALSAKIRDIIRRT